MMGTFLARALHATLRHGCAGRQLASSCGTTIPATEQVMRALTVAPGIANSARVEDVPEPPRVRRRRAGAHPGARRLRHRPRNRVGRLRLGAAGRKAAGDRPRIARRSVRGARRQRTSPRRSRRRHRAPARSGAVPGLRGRRMGYVPQRPLHRARHQGAQRLRCRIFSASSPTFCVKVDRALGDAGVLVEPTSVVAKAWDHTERIGRRSRAWQPQTLLGHRRRADRSARRTDRRAARPRRPCARPS